MAYDFGPLSFEDMGVKQIFTNRTGGFSKGAYAAFNMGFSTGDDIKNVHENYYKLKEAEGLEDFVFVRTKQTHSNNIKVIDKKFLDDIVDKEVFLEDYDGLITDQIGVVLTTYYADCTPVFFLDKKKKVIGINHSGWRGTRNRISAEMISIFTQAYGSSLEDIMVYIGPNISKCCYEVSEDLYNEFRDFHKHNVIEPSDLKKGKYYLDMKKAIEVTLLEKGIARENIVISDECTSCLKDKYYSYRRDNKVTGRMSGMMWIEK